MITKNSDNQSIDEAIMNFLSEKLVADKTEKLALNRISSRTKFSIEQVELSIRRLTVKNLLRRVYVQGNVGFELTPRAQQKIDEIARAETARVTIQIQEAISRERKAKLRTNRINKIISNEEKWQNYEIPDMNQNAKIEIESAELLKNTKEVFIQQPLCYKNPKNYDNEFTQYKLKIEALIEKNINLVRLVSNYLRISNNLSLINFEIEKINRTIKTYELVADAAAQVNQLKSALSRLKAVQSRLENYINWVSRFEGLKTQLSDNIRLLGTLKKPTHDFMPIKREISLEKAAWYSDPEVPIKNELEITRTPLEEKCRKCGIKRKSTPVNIG